MARERKWIAVSQSFTADGTALGVVTVATAINFKVKARVIIQSSTRPQAAFEIKNIPNEITVSEDNVKTRYCNFCQCDHPLTEEFWAKQNGKLRKCKFYTKIWRQSHSSEIKEYAKIWKSKNKEALSVYHRNYLNEQYKINIQHKLRVSLRTRLLVAVKGIRKAGSAIKDLGCSVEEFKVYLESKFQPGMTWKNWTVNGWHIDHIIPLSAFDLTDREQFLKACHYTNLQPLWAEENNQKGSNVNWQKTVFD